MENPKNHYELMNEIIEKYSSYGGMIDFIPDKTARCFICINNQKKGASDIGIIVNGVDLSFHKDCIDDKAKQYWKDKANNEIKI